MQTLSRDELPRRRPVWDALSAFFLDTQLDDSALREIAGELRSSGYTESQLDDILTRELGPLLYPNLCLWVTVAGVWDGFDVGWIETQVLAGKHLRIRRWWNFGERLICGWVVRNAKEQYWRRVLDYLREGEVRGTT